MGLSYPSALAERVLRGSAIAASLLLVACTQEVPLTPAEQAAKDRSECQALAIGQSGFDPLTAEAPPRTISSTSRRGGNVVGEGDIVEGAAKGAVLGVVGGAIMGDAGRGAGAGAAIGGLMGGARRHQETNEMVTTTHTNPEYTKFEEAKSAFRNSFDTCLAQRAAQGASE
jgi:hypothetical protein